jgi:guanylate kinase
VSGPLQLERPDLGALFVVSGPSGVGKSTLVRAIMERVPDLTFSVSATTRAPRPGEVDGQHYRFLTPEGFADLERQSAFLEHATVYGRRYGTLSRPVEEAVSAGRSVLLDIDVQGARQVKVRYPACVRVYVLPPALSVLEERLRRRGTDGEDVLRRRMAQVDEQLRGAPEFDYVVVNDHLETARAVFEGVFLAELARPFRRRLAIERVLAELS